MVPALRPGTEADSHLLKVLNSLRGLRRRDPNSGGRAFFCTDSSDGSCSESDQGVEAEDKAAESGADEADSIASAIVSTNPRPEDYLTVSFGGFLIYCVFILIAGLSKKVFNNPKLCVSTTSI